jgi:hypothetical protein
MTRRSITIRDRIADRSVRAQECRVSALGVPIPGFAMSSAANGARWRLAVSTLRSTQRSGAPKEAP